MPGCYNVCRQIYLVGVVRTNLARFTELVDIILYPFGRFSFHFRRSKMRGERQLLFICAALNNTTHYKCIFELLSVIGPMYIGTKRSLDESRECCQERVPLHLIIVVLHRMLPKENIKGIARAPI